MGSFISLNVSVTALRFLSANPTPEPTWRRFLGTACFLGTDPVVLVRVLLLQIGDLDDAATLCSDLCLRAAIVASVHFM